MTTMLKWAEATGSKDVLMALCNGVDVMTIMQSILQVGGIT